MQYPGYVSEPRRLCKNEKLSLFSGKYRYQSVVTQFIIWSLIPFKKMVKIQKYMQLERAFLGLCLSRNFCLCSFILTLLIFQKFLSDFFTCMSTNNLWLWDWQSIEISYCKHLSCHNASWKEENRQAKKVRQMNTAQLNMRKLERHEMFYTSEVLVLHCHSPAKFLFVKED